MAKKKWGKRHVVDVGDVVQGRATQRWGVLIGTVAKVVSKNEVIVQALAGDGDDVVGVRWLLQTRIPTGHTKAGDDRADLVPHIARVLHRASAPPKPKKQRVVVEISDAETLIEHLAGEREIGKHEFPIINIDTA
jgi:hypothetical protein